MCFTTESRNDNRTPILMSKYPAVQDMAGRNVYAQNQSVGGTLAQTSGGDGLPPPKDIEGGSSASDTDTAPSKYDLLLQTVDHVHTQCSLLAFAQSPLPLPRNLTSIHFAW